MLTVNVLAHLHLCDSFFCQKASLWPGSKGVARKKHRREKKSNQRSYRTSAKCGGPIGLPYIGIPLFLGKEGLARPVQEMMPASWFFLATPLLPGQAMPESQSILRLLGEN
jgi:hypothetical protein